MIEEHGVRVEESIYSAFNWFMKEH